MSTRSYICIETKENEYKGIYCHSDGYLTYNGAMLIDHYQDREKVEKLISLGNLSTLCEKVEPDPRFPHSFDYTERQSDVCVFYGRDRGESKQDAHPVTLKQLAEDPWIEYVYIYGLDDTWRYFEYEDINNMTTVQEGLDKEFKQMGIDRPEGIYGYYTASDIATIKQAEANK